MFNYTPILNSDTILNASNSRSLYPKYLSFINYLSEFLTKEEKKLARDNINAQIKLISGENIVTINGQSLLQNKDLTITGSGDIIDTSKFATKEDLKNKIDANLVYTIQQIDDKGFITSIPIEYITEEKLAAKGFLTEHQNIDNKLDITSYTEDKKTFALKTDMASLITKNELKLKQDKLIGTVIEGQNIKTINGASILGQGNIEIKSPEDIIKVESVNNKTGAVVLSANDLNAPTIEEMNITITEKVPTKISLLQNDSGFLTKHLDVSDKLSKSIYEADKLSFALKTEVDKALELKTDKSTVTDMATQTWVVELGFLKKHQDISNKLDKTIYEEDKKTFAIKSEIDEVLTVKVNKEEILDMETQTHARETYLPIGNYQKLGNYALKSDLNSLATKEDLNLKQDKLVNGVTIKTINDLNILGEGNIISVGKATGLNLGEIFNNYSTNKAYGEYSHAEGNNTKSYNTEITEIVIYNPSSPETKVILNSSNKWSDTSGKTFSLSKPGQNSVNLHKNYSNKVYVYEVPEDFVFNYKDYKATYSTSSGEYSGYKVESVTFSGGTAAHVEGSNTESYGINAHAEGSGSIALGDYSHSQNENTYAENYAQTSLGRYNLQEQEPSKRSFDATKALLSIGNGSFLQGRSDALRMLGNGTMWISGIGGFTGTNLTAENSLQATIKNIQNKPGTPGPPGNTPYIGINGNWYIGDEDTGVQAQGPLGEPGTGGGTTVLDKQNFILNTTNNNSIKCIIKDGDLFFYSLFATGIFCYSLNQNKILWQSNMNSAAGLGKTLIVLGKYLYTVGDNNFRIIKFNKNTGDIVAEQAHPDKITYTTTQQNYLFTFVNTLYCWSPITKTIYSVNLKTLALSPINKWDGEIEAIDCADVWGVFYHKTDKKLIWFDSQFNETNRNDEMPSALSSIVKIKCINKLLRTTLLLNTKYAWVSDENTKVAVANNLGTNFTNTFCWNLRKVLIIDTINEFSVISNSNLILSVNGDSYLLYPEKEQFIGIIPYEVDNICNNIPDDVWVVVNISNSKRKVIKL